jgi:hypothetical protein
VESNWVHSALWPPIGVLCPPQLIMMMEKLVELWLAEETEVLRKPAPVPFCPPQTPHAARTRTRAATVRSQWLTPWAMAQPKLNVKWGKTVNWGTLNGGSTAYPWVSGFQKTLALYIVICPLLPSLSCENYLASIIRFLNIYCCVNVFKIK